MNEKLAIVLQENRVGKIELSRVLLFQDMELIRKGFALLKFMPMEIIPNLIKGTVEFIGYSPKFESLSKGQAVREYIIRIKRNEKGEIETIDIT